MMPPTRVFDKRFESYDRGRGFIVGAGQSMTNEIMCACEFFYKVWPCYMNLLRSYVPFCYRPLPLPRPLFAIWPEQLISSPLAHDQTFH